MRLSTLAAIACLTLPSALIAQTANPVTESQLLSHIEILASDEYGGRKPGTEGEAKTLYYLAKQWFDAGLVSGTKKPGAWYKPVPLIERTPLGSTVAFHADGKPVKVSDQIVLRSRNAVAKLSDKKMLFVGYGVDKDGAVLGNVKGKVAFMLLSSLSNTKRGAGYRDRRVKLVKAGAAAVIAVNDRKTPWARLKNSFATGAMVLVDDDQTAPLDGAVSKTALRQIMGLSKDDLDNAIKSAKEKAFQPIPIAGMMNATVETDVRKFNSHNVIAKIPGKNPKSGAVLFMGHWDHFGTCRDASEKDRICNGAVDNASGMAVLVEVAKRLGGGPQPDRDIYFVGTTAEERGLLGAYAFANDPAVPLDKIAIALNVDTVAIAPKGSKVAIIGRGETSLDAIVDNITRQLGREVEMSKDANAFIRRQDGWALAAKKVPALMAGGSFSDLELMGKFLSKDYHTPKDEVNDDLELGGAAEDANLHIALGRFFGDLEKYPAKSSYLIKED